MRLLALLAAAAATGGLHGTVTRGPTTPVCRVGVPCSAPAPGAVLAFARGGRVVARVRAGAAGRYAIRLPAGVYAVALQQAPRIGFGVRPTAVRVVADRERRVDFSIDTGIR